MGSDAVFTNVNKMIDVYFLQGLSSPKVYESLKLIRLAEKRSSDKCMFFRKTYETNYITMFFVWFYGLRIILKVSCRLNFK